MKNKERDVIKKYVEEQFDADFYDAKSVWWFVLWVYDSTQPHYEVVESIEMDATYNKYYKNNMRWWALGYLASIKK